MILSHKKRKVQSEEGVPVVDLPPDARATKFDLTLADYILHVEVWMDKWRWRLSADVGETHVIFSGECKTPSAAITEGKSAVDKAVILGAEPW